MTRIIYYIKDYIQRLDKRLFILSVLFITAGIIINYRYGLNNWINRQPAMQQYISWYLIFGTALSVPYIFQLLLKKHKLFANKQFILLLLLAPAIFSWKMVYDVEFTLSSNQINNSYWNKVIYWPFKLVIVTLVLFIIWKFFGKGTSFYGLTIKQFHPKPYVWMLLIMVPLVAAAAIQPDFLAMYPKFQKVNDLMYPGRGWKVVLYELSYGTDFLTIELFFRGFLILAFLKWAGKDAILPMALFYCTIHFGKPLGECISSFFGGIILGIITYQTRTIVGGLMVHLGIAWLMELGGYIGNYFVS